MTIARQSVLAALAASLAFAQLQQPPKTAAPSFSIVASVSGLVRAPSELLLDIAMTNTSQRAIPLGYVFGPPSWMSFTLDIRDSAGKPVAETPFGKQAHALQTSSGPAISQAAGETVHHVLDLNRLFDLSRPGEYSVQVRRGDDASGTIVKSNSVTLRVPSPGQAAPAPSPAISVSIAALSDSVRPGWRIPVEIAVRNISPQTVSLAVWRGQGAYHEIREAEEFGSGIEVRGSQGSLVALTPCGEAARSGQELPAGAFVLVPIQPGAVWKEPRAIGEISDIGAPGRYAVEAELTDPASGLPVKSNSIGVTVTTPERASLAPARPPFVVTIRNENEPQPTASGRRYRFPILLCMTNISARPIALDNSAVKDRIEVWDSHGAPAPLTSDGAYLRKAFAEGTASGGNRIAPGDSLCGVLTLGPLYDFAAPGEYSVQAARADEPDLRPGQKLADAPMVKSNVIPLLVGEAGAK